MFAEKAILPGRLKLPSLATEGASSRLCSLIGLLGPLGPFGPVPREDRLRGSAADRSLKNKPGLGGFPPRLNR